jgi:hypothetical protein
MAVGSVCLWLPRIHSGVGACFDLVGTSERLLYAYHVRYVWSRTLCGLSMESIWRVDQVFTCRVYIVSNCHDSWI